MRPTPLVLAAFALISLLSSCSVLPEPEPDDGLTKYQRQHKAFQEQESTRGLIYKNEELVPLLSPESSRIEISVSDQRARVYAGEEVAIDTPVSTGKKSHPTPTGDFTIIEKKKDKRSNLYGNIYNSGGKWVANGDRRKKKVPSGGKFVGASMPYWMRLTRTGIGLHVGRVPNYPASHGCIRLPSKIAPVIFTNTKLGTPVSIKSRWPEPAPAPVADDA